MTLWERIERWRSDKVLTLHTTAKERCADELEADLRELQKALDKLIEAGQEFRQKAVMVNLQTREVDIGALTAMNQAWDAARCALEARIGRPG